jgi:hypothetical protein
MLTAATMVSAQGKKYALLVGINDYQGGISKLKGTVNDVNGINKMLTSKFGFNAANVTVLTDGAATRDAILSNIQNIKKNLKTGDLFVFHYSGHGTLFPDKYSEYLDETNLIFMEEEDEDTDEMVTVYPRATYDSAIVPVDGRSETSGKPWGNLILDDELYETFGAITRQGARVVFLSDSCHSGSVGKGMGDAQVRTTTLATVKGVKNYSDLKFDEPATQKAGAMQAPEMGKYIVMSGSKDNEYSLDVRVGGVPGGLFTIMLLRKLDTVGADKLSYKQVMDSVTKDVSTQSLAMDNDQNPVLDATYGDTSMAIFSTGAAMPKNTKSAKVESESSKEVKSTFVKESTPGESDPRIKQSEGSNDPDASLVDPRATKKSANDQALCGLTVNNNTPWFTNIYFNGGFGGSLAPWSSYSYYLNPGFTEVYARANFNNGAYRFWTASYGCSGGQNFYFTAAP